MDAIDSRLLALLRANARAPVAVLARQLGVARATVSARMARLQRAGIIDGFTVRMSEDAGKRGVASIVMLNVNPKLGDRVVAGLRKVPEVSSLKAISGVYDLVAEVRTDDIAAADRVLDEIGRLPGVERTMSLIVLSTKFAR